MTLCVGTKCYKRFFPSGDWGLDSLDGRLVGTVNELAVDEQAGAERRLALVFRGVPLVRESGGHC